MFAHKTLLFGAIGTLALICGSVAVNVQSSNAAEPKTSTLVTVSYRTADFPIWNESGKGFDHAILVSLLKAKIGTDNWNDDHSISTYAMNVSLVVSTTRENHEVIAKTLDQFRVDRFKRSPEFKRSAR